MATKSKRTPRLVLIVWEDAVMDTEPWPTDDDVANFGPETVYAVGWLIKKTKTSYTMAHQYNENGVGGMWNLPRGMVKSLVVIKSGAEMAKIIEGTVTITKPRKTKGN